MQSSLTSAFVNPRANQRGPLTNQPSLPKLRGPNPNSLFANNIADSFKSSFSNASINELLGVLNVSKTDMKLLDNLNQDPRQRVQ
jgi:hypothetical protein